MKACPNLPTFGSFATCKTECNCRIISCIIMRPFAAIKPSCLKWSFSFVKFLLSCDFCCHRVAWSWLRLVSSNPDNSEPSSKHMCSTMTFFLRIAAQTELWSHVDICLHSPILYPLSNIDAWSINLTSVGSELGE